MALILLFILGGYLLCNVWIVWWTYRALRGNRPLQITACLLLAIWASLFPWLYRNGGGSWPEIWLLRLGAVWLGMFFYLFCLTLFDDLFSYFKYHRKRRARPPQTRPRYFAFGVIYGAVLLLTIGGWLNAAFPKVTEIDLAARTDQAEFPELDHNTITIAAISDLHLGRTISNARFARALKLLQPYQPEVIFLLGDVLDDHLGLDLDAIRATVAELQPRFGLWAILGNHEYHSGEHSQELLEECGIKVLRDEWTVLGNSVLVIGRDDYSVSRFGSGSRKGLPELLEKIPDEYLKLPLIVLDHQPQRLADAEEVNAVLQLSGHTHNGQLWPFNLITGQVFENGCGCSVRGDTHCVVSVGTGTWGPPIRNNARPEVLLIRLHFSNQSDSPFHKEE